MISHSCLGVFSIIDPPPSPTKRASNFDRVSCYTLLQTAHIGLKVSLFRGVWLLKISQTCTRKKTMVDFCYSHSQVNSASYPQWEGKWVVAYGIRSKGLVADCDWGGGMSACCKSRVQLFADDLKRAMDGRIVCSCVISSCQSAATSEIVKALLVFSPSHVRSAVAGTGLYSFYNGMLQSGHKAAFLHYPPGMLCFSL